MTPMIENVTLVGSLIQAKHLEEGDILLGLDNGYVVEVEEGNGYLSYPRVGPGMNMAMPKDTMLITYHDADGEENYLLASPSTVVLVRRD